MDNPLNYFIDPVLRAPTIGCMLMCLSAALVGVIVFVRKRSLLGESLSHATYPGVTLAIVVAVLFQFSGNFTLLILIGAFCSALVGLICIDLLERYMKVRSDSALTFVLAAFFGIGLTIASRLQFTHTHAYRQIQQYLYGQAATMTDIHVVIYGAFSFIIILLIILLYKELQVISFDRQFAKSTGISEKWIDPLTFFLIVLAIVIGIRSVGVVLMSAMLIAPATAARQYTNHLSKMFILAAVFGLLSGFFGNYFSVEVSHYLEQKYPDFRASLPTGPMIVLFASFICFFSLLFAKERGLVLRMVRIVKFRYRRLQENLLKAIWRASPEKGISFAQIVKMQSHSPLYLRYILHRLVAQGWLQKKLDQYILTQDGTLRAARIVRLHRLWEVYLVNYLGLGVERVHKDAEEMEHIITPELEQKLTELLHDPKQDPHRQPIPTQQEVMRSD